MTYLEAAQAKYPGINFASPASVARGENAAMLKNMFPGRYGILMPQEYVPSVTAKNSKYDAIKRAIKLEGGMTAKEICERVGLGEYQTRHYLLLGLHLGDFARAPGGKPARWHTAQVSENPA